jgi:hypothetical protein
MCSDAAGDRAFVGLAIAFEGGLGLVALALGALLGQSPLAEIGWDARAAGQGFLAAAPLLAGLWLMTRWPVGPLGRLDELVRRLVVPLFRNCAMWELLLVAAAAGFGEELLFRGLAQRGIEQLSGSPWLAVALASAIFGLAHPISTTYAVLAALIGVYLGWLLLATDNLLVPIVTHAAYDFLALVYLLRRDRGADLDANVPDAAAVDVARDL